jgi:hypothetical protein
MHKTLRNIVTLLDGQPTKMRGQSLVEMTVTFPLLILMILALAEVGFIANNYMILMDVVRGAGRAATNLDPLLFPAGDARNQERMDCDGIPNLWHLYSKDSTVDDPGTNVRGDHLPGYSVNGTDGNFMFFDEVLCQAMRTLAPLRFNDSDTGKDDVVLSVISYTLMDYNALGVAKNGPNYASKAGTRGDVWVTVTGRWPVENRYCNNGTVGDSRDPFDYKSAEFSSAFRTGPANDTNEGPPTGGSVLTSAGNQQVRGFVFTGRGKDESNVCYGSRFTVQDIEERLNLNAIYNKNVPNGALIIVEFYWQHHPLFLGPLFQGFTGNPVNDPVLHVWGWFPVMAAEPTPTP